MDKRRNTGEEVKRDLVQLVTQYWATDEDELPVIGREEAAALWDRRRDPTARNQLIEGMLPVLGKIAGGILKKIRESKVQHGVDGDDLTAIGIDALVELIKNEKKERDGGGIRKLISVHARRAMWRFVNEQHLLSNLKGKADKEQSEKKIAQEWVHGPRPWDGLVDDEARAALPAADVAMAERAQDVSQKQIAKEMGVSEATVSTRLRQGQARLKSIMGIRETRKIPVKDRASQPLLDCGGGLREWLEGSGYHQAGFTTTLVIVHDRWLRFLRPRERSDWSKQRVHDELERLGFEMGKNTNGTLHVRGLNLGPLLSRRIKT
jgi:transposase